MRIWKLRHSSLFTCISAITSLLSVSLIMASGQTTQRFILEPSQSKFIAHAEAGGLLWFKGHDHYLAARKFSGEVQMTPERITPASLRLVVQADSLEETGADFTDQQKQIINKELKDIVLQPAQYPEIVFQSTAVTSKAIASGQYELEITGDLTLHGVTKRIKIPTKLTLSGENLRASGKFSIDRDDYKVKATSAAHGLVRVENKVKFEFDIVGRRK
jgi:polyisoprenoid-binding protein YceI